MPNLKCTITLLGDAEPGSGLGSDYVNDYITRDRKGRPILPSTHIKGLLRDEAWKRLAFIDGEKAKQLIFSCFGFPGEDEDSGEFSFLNFIFLRSAANCALMGGTRLISRTSIAAESNTAKNMSLRTTEAIRSGSVFVGKILSFCPPDSPEGLLLRLCLLSLSAIGGGRNRGSGYCRVDYEWPERMRPEGDCISSTTDNPAELLKDLTEKLTAYKPGSNISSLVQVQWDGAVNKDDKAVLLRAVFVAETPVCCPEVPVRSAVNSIQGGFAIPSSAFQGCLLTLIRHSCPDMADALFSDPRFRAWPLLPNQSPRKTSIKVSLTHKVAKLSSPENMPHESWFQDEAVKAYKWEELNLNQPLKAADGVLVFGKNDAAPSLWKSASMPRWISAHGVHNNPSGEQERNVYSVESMAPGLWTGLLSLPEYAAKLLIEKILPARDKYVAFGKGRTVRGLGRLYLYDAGADETPRELLAHEKENAVLVFQSPILLSPDAHGKNFREKIQRVMEQWIEKNKLALKVEKEHVWGLQGVRFGWRRHGDKGGRLPARLVILPGGVVRLSGEVDQDALAQALAGGIGEGREEGFGAVAVHPGCANSLYGGPGHIRREKSNSGRRTAITIALEMLQKHQEWYSDMHAAYRALPSASQLRAVWNMILNEKQVDDEQIRKKNVRERIDEFLKRQGTRRESVRVVWEPVQEMFTRLWETPDLSCNDIVACIEFVANLVSQVEGDSHD